MMSTIATESTILRIVFGMSHPPLQFELKANIWPALNIPIQGERLLFGELTVSPLIY
jgi:hypothetical protein